MAFSGSCWLGYKQIPRRHGLSCFKSNLYSCGPICGDSSLYAQKRLHGLFLKRNTFFPARDGNHVTNPFFIQINSIVWNIMYAKVPAGMFPTNPACAARKIALIKENRLNNAIAEIQERTDLTTKQTKAKILLCNRAVQF